MSCIIKLKSLNQKREIGFIKNFVKIIILGKLTVTKLFEGSKWEDFL